MLRLMLLRHAKTERPALGEPDRERKLAKRGRTDVPLVGAYMARHGLVPDLALVSPAARAWDTWELLASCFAKVPKAVREERIYNADRESLIGLIATTHGARSLLMVGHNPGIHDLAVQLIASGDAEARERLTEKLPTSGLVVIDLPFDDWSRLHAHAGRLERFVSPRSLAAATE